MDASETQDLLLEDSCSSPDSDVVAPPLASTFSFSGALTSPPAHSSSSSSSYLCFLTSSGSEDSCASSSSSEMSSTSGGSREIPVVVLAAVPPQLAGEASGADLAAELRERCVGRHDRVSWGFTSVIGRRREMEDAVAVVPGFISRTCSHIGGCTAPGSRCSDQIFPVHFFGAYDGHGGSQVNLPLYSMEISPAASTELKSVPVLFLQVARFCAERMHEIIIEEWEKEAMNEFEWRIKWENTLSKGFQRVDEEVFTEAVANDMVGSTAVVALLSGCQIILSNCGDSRAVLCRGMQTIPLTVDQKPDREDELMRIEREGGRVINWGGARVLGVLAMSRAIGDRYMRPYVIPVPEITFMTRSNEDECLILASDVLWDVMSNDEVGEVARRLLRRRRRIMVADGPSPAQFVADSLTQMAMRRDSQDNISIIVVDLKSRRRPQPGE